MMSAQSAEVRQGIGPCRGVTVGARLDVIDVSAFGRTAWHRASITITLECRTAQCLPVRRLIVGVTRHASCRLCLVGEGLVGEMGWEPTQSVVIGER